MILRLLLTLALCIVSMRLEAAPRPAEGARLAGRVREIFDAKCVDCHGPDLARPKGKFGYVLDLQRVADNPDYIVRGDPGNSDLYRMVFDEEMPGDEAKVPPLTKEEKAIVKRWIDLGAPAAPAATPKPRPAVAALPTPVQPVPQPFWMSALRWAGEFHPVATHFPVALMLVAVLAEALGWWTRRESWFGTVRFLVAVAALGAFVASILGWLNAAFSSYSKTVGALLWWHRWVGTGTTVWVLICGGLLLLYPCEEGSKERRQFRGALMLGAALVSISGFLGSALIYGLDHYAWR